MLIVSEVVEAQQVLRNPYDGAVDAFTNMTEAQGYEFLEELADVVIRVLDLTEYFGWNIGETILAKMSKNSLRPHKHGKRF